MAHYFFRKGAPVFPQGLGYFRGRPPRLNRGLTFHGRRSDSLGSAAPNSCVSGATAPAAATAEGPSAPGASGSAR
eukprot:scaffold141902_cov19-Tisochrysis_lutea.AAC.3